MTTPRDRPLAVVKEMPDTATWDDILYKFYVLQKIEAGMRADDAGETVSHEELEKILFRKWATTPESNEV